LTPVNLSRFAGEVETCNVEGEGERVGTQRYVPTRSPSPSVLTHLDLSHSVGEVVSHVAQVGL